MSKTLLVGIDVHAEKNSCAFTDDKGNRLTKKAFSVQNNLPRAEELEKRIETAMKEGAFDNLLIATEASSFLDLHLVDYLANSKNLARHSPLIISSTLSLPLVLRRSTLILIGPTILTHL